MKRAAAVAVAFLVAGCGNNPSRLEQVAELCEVPMSDETLVMNTQGDEDTEGDTIEDVACVLYNLDTSDAVIAQIDSTSALMGAQTAEIDAGYVLRWSYHPDTGLVLTIR